MNEIQEFLRDVPLQWSYCSHRDRRLRLRMFPRILVITSCTGEKRYKPQNQLKLEDFQDVERLRKRESELSDYACDAAALYTGTQHLRLMEGIKLLRESLGFESLDLKILSAGYGLVDEKQMLVPYEVTFNVMKAGEIDSWGRSLQIKEDLEAAIEPYNLVFFLLGDNYLRAAQLPIESHSEKTFIFLTSTKRAQRIPKMKSKTYIWPLSNTDAKRYGYGLVGLKGFLFKRFSENVAETSSLLEKVYEHPDKFKMIIEQEQVAEDIQKQLTLTSILKQVPVQKPEQKAKKKSLRSPKEFISIPDIPVAPNAALGMDYFIPEWDDHVDPGYDFLNSRLTPARDPYADEVYAHQIYDKPNYDGILVSKVVVDSSKKKRQRVEAVGIHDFIRFQGKVMGDCGAFGYIKEDIPPFDTDEILEYYENLGFNCGVSIDHLIVGPFAEPGIREQRYELTLKNAQEFLEKHNARGYTFTPMGVVQGWTSETYAAAARDTIRMGYKHIAIGGVARTPSKQIVEILKAIRPHLTAQTRLHLFGVARLDAIPAFRHLGVTSFDSASALRRAWLGAGANYHDISGEMYTAVRIPPVDGHGVRVKRLVEAGVASREQFRALEQSALKALRAFDQEQCSFENALEALLAYDELLELPQDGKVNSEEQAKRRLKHGTMYEHLLRDKPWKRCDCPICERIGVEVVIFRGNDRNRRRGFHNTYVFYKRFQALLEKLDSGIELQNVSQI